MSTEAQPVTPVTTATPTPPPNPEPLTPEQQDAERIRKATSFLAGKIIDQSAPPKPKEDKPPEPVKPPDPNPADGKQTEQPPKPEPKTKPRKQKPPEETHSLSPEQIATIAASAAVEVTKRKEEPATEPDANLELAEEFAADRKYYEWMQRENPRKYGKLINQIAEWGPKELDYIEQWERENPGSKYDPESDDHNEFYSQNQPKIDPNDLQSARRKVAEVEKSLEKEKLKREIMEDMAPELSEIRMQKVARAAAPKLQSAAHAIIESVLGGMNPDYVQHSKDKAKLDEIAESDPIASDVGQQMAGKYVPLVTEVVAFHQGVPFNKDNPAHVDMYYRTLRLEDMVSRLPADQQLHEGRRFSTQAQYQAMTPQQRSQHWIIGEPELLYDIEREAASETQSLYKLKSDEFARYSKRKAPVAATNGKHEEKAAPAQSSQRPSAPSVVPGPAVTPGSSGSIVPSKSGLDRFHERLVGAR